MRRIRVRNALAAILAGALLVTIGPTLAHAQPSESALPVSLAPGDSQYGFQNYKSGMMIQPDRNADGSDSAASYVKMVQRPMVILGNDLKPAQNWRVQKFVTTSPYDTRLVAGDSSLRMGINFGGAAAGASAIQAPADISANQKWLILHALGFPADVYQIMNYRSGMCLGVDGASTLSGAWVLQFPCDLSLNQSWRIIDR